MDISRPNKCPHSEYVKNKSKAEKRAIQRRNQRYKQFVEKLGAINERDIQYWAGDFQRNTNGKWKSATQLSEIGDITPYGSKKTVPNSIVVRFHDTMLLGSIPYSFVKRDIACIPKGYSHTKGITIMYRRLTGTLFQRNGDEGWVRVKYANGEELWYRPSNLYDAEKYGENGRKRSPPTKFVPGVKEEAEYNTENVSSSAQRAHDQRIIDKIYPLICKSLDDNDQNSHEVAIDSALQGKETGIDVHHVKDLARTSLIFDILTSSKNLEREKKDVRPRPKIIPNWEQVILLQEEQEAKEREQENKKKAKKNKKGEQKNDDNGSSEQAGEDGLRESGISKYIEHIINHVRSSAEKKKEAQAKQEKEELAKKTMEAQAKRTMKAENENTAKKRPKNIRLCVKCEKSQARCYGSQCRKCFKKHGVSKSQSSNLFCWKCETRRPVKIGGRCKTCISNGSSNVKMCSKCKTRPRQFGGDQCECCLRAERERKAAIEEAERMRKAAMEEAERKRNARAMEGLNMVCFLALPLSSDALPEVVASSPEVVASSPEVVASSASI